MMLRIGLSQSSFPSSTRIPSPVTVTDLVIDPIAKIVSSVTGNCRSTSFQPYPFDQITWPSCDTATARPWTVQSFIVELMNSSMPRRSSAASVIVDACTLIAGWGSQAEVTDHVRTRAETARIRMEHSLGDAARYESSKPNHYPTLSE